MRTIQPLAAFWVGVSHYSSGALSVKRLVRGWTIRISNPGGGEIFRNQRDRPRGTPSLLYNKDRVSLPGVKRPGRGVSYQPPSSAVVE